MSEWPEARVREILAEGGGYHGVESELGITRGAVRDYFRRRGIRVRDLIPEAKAPETPTLATLQGWIRDAAEAVGAELADLTPRDVYDATPARARDFRPFGGFRRVLRDLEPRDGAEPSEVQGLSVRVAYTRRLERDLGRRDYVAGRLERALLGSLEAAPVRLGTPPSRGEYSGERLLTALVSDTHFGLEIDPAEVPGNSWSWEIAARCMGKLAEEICSWKPEHRARTGLRLAFLGDLFEGVIHLDDRGVGLLVEQIHGSVQIVSAFAQACYRAFPSLEIVCLPGNHERMTKERAVAQRWNSGATLVYSWLARLFQGTGVKVHVPRSGDLALPLPGEKVLAYYNHGDIWPSAGNAQRSIATGKLKSALDALNASGEYDRPIRVLNQGHEHQPVIAPFPSGTAIVNGCLSAANGYARNAIGVRGGGQRLQVLYESTVKHPVGDVRIVDLRGADQEPRFEEIVPAPSWGFGTGS